VTTEIALVLTILVVSLILFVTERVRMDVVALMVLGTLGLSGLVTPSAALSGFSNPAVITVWAMFMLSAGLSKTGVAEALGRQVLRFSGRNEAQTIVVIMLTAAVLSAFMNNIGVAALMLPVAMEVARRTGHPPSRLLMPLAYASLLGGLTTLIGTPPNLLVSEALDEAGLQTFRLFDFTPVGSAALIGGTLFIAMVGRRVLPRRDPARETAANGRMRLPEQYSLHERAVMMRVPSGSPLAGRSLEESRLGSALGLNAIGILRGNETVMAPNPTTVLQVGDRLLVSGGLDRFHKLQGWRELELEHEEEALDRLTSDDVLVTEIEVGVDSPVAGLTLRDSDFRNRYGVFVLAIRSLRPERQLDLSTTVLENGHRLLVQGVREQVEALCRTPGFEHFHPVTRDELVETYAMHERVFAARVPAETSLIGDSLAGSRLGEAFGLRVLEIVRDGVSLRLPDPQEELQTGDRLLVQGRGDKLRLLRGLRELEIIGGEEPDLERLESSQVGLVEATLAPRSTLVGKTLRQLHFRSRYGLGVLAIWRQGRAYRSNLRDMELQFGDALLFLGPREKIDLLGQEPDFLVLTREVREPIDRRRAPLAALIMAAVLVPVFAGWLPISLSAVVGATLMVLTGCLSMNDAYRAVEWRSIFLIAGMLPLGVAMQETGATDYLAGKILGVVGPWGPWGVVMALYLMTAAATMIIPTAALVVLMAPIAIDAAGSMGMSPYAVMMAVAMAASASFTSPISHPANVLVMGPGGYRFVDYLKLGVPLTLVVLVLVLLVLPIFWPFTP
jgi:di/tricarboxylate transporter